MLARTIWGFFWSDGRQTAPYSPELEPDIVLTEPHASRVDETCTPFGDRRGPKVAALLCTWWPHNAALGGRIG